jgi:hypothetical protein
MAAISGVVSSSSREVPYAPASVSGSDVGTARAYNNASATISFTAPVHDGGLPVTGYEVTSSPGGFTASGSSSPLTIAGLSSSTSYTYNVTATNSIGTGPAITSGSVFATTIPQPVTIGTATATGAAGTVTVAFTANGTGGKTVTYTATSSPGGFTGSSSGSPITVTGLTNGTAYTFTVVASNANGSAAASGASNSATPFTTPPPPPTPGPIGSSTPVASASGNTVSSTSGAWGAGTTPTSYQYNLYRSDGTYIATSGSVSTSTTSISFTASYSTSYYVTVTASNSNGNGTMTSNTVTTGAEPAPVVAPGSMAGRVSGSWSNGLATWTWSPPTTGTAPFSYEYSLGYGFTSTNSTSYSVYADSQALTVRAVNSAGTGESGSFTVTRPPVVTSPGSMSGLVSGSYNGSTLQSNFSWSAPTGTAPFTYYYSYGGTTFSTTGTTANTSGGATITVYASNSAGSGSAGSYTTVSTPAVTAPGSMAGLVSGYYAGQSYFNWSAPTGTSPFTYYYSFGGAYTSTTGTSATTSGYASITVFASNPAGSGGDGSFTLTPPAPTPSKWYCTTSAQCAGIGNCSYNGGSDTNQTGSGTGYNIACSYNNTGTYPPCQSSAGATCTGNLSCCSQGLKYRCSDYDVNNSASVNYFQCYGIGDCDANSDPAGVRTRCCPTEC